MQCRAHQRQVREVSHLPYGRRKENLETRRRLKLLQSVLPNNSSQRKSVRNYMQYAAKMNQKIKASDGDPRSWPPADHHPCDNPSQTLQYTLLHPLHVIYNHQNIRCAVIVINFYRLIVLYQWLNNGNNPHQGNSLKKGFKTRTLRTWMCNQIDDSRTTTRTQKNTDY